MDNNVESLTVKPAEAAKLLSVSLPVVYELCRRDDFPVIRFGRSIVIPRAGLERWVDAQTEIEKGNS